VLDQPADATQASQRFPARGVLPVSKESAAADGIGLSEDQLSRLNNLTPAAGARPDEASMATVDQ
jgi:hypothetical protein